MIIRSDDGTAEISKGSFEDPWDLDVSVETKGFSGKVYNIFPTSTGEFFQQIRAIERDNCGRAVLVGTEDFELVIELPQGRGAFWVELSLADGFGNGRPPARSLHCRLRVDGEYWHGVVAGLRSELVGYPPGVPN